VNVDAAANGRWGSRDSYGRWRVRVQRNHAALLLRIGHLVITEWSHSASSVSGTGRPYQQLAPKLYQRHYTGATLRRDADFDGAHMGAERGSGSRSLPSTYVTTPAFVSTYGS